MQEHEKEEQSEAGARHCP